MFIGILVIILSVLLLTAISMIALRLNDRKKTNRAVIFDTNAYRVIVRDRTEKESKKVIRKLLKLEKRKDVVAFGSVIVAIEMLANLAEGPGGFNFENCKNGVIGMADHIHSDEHNMPKVIPNAAMHITKSLFNQVPTKLDQEHRNLGGVIHDFRINSDDALRSHSVKTFEDIKNWVDSEEATFTSQIEDLVSGAETEIRKLNPGASDDKIRIELLKVINNGQLLDVMALAIVYVAAGTLGLNPSNSEITNKKDALKNVLPLAAGFYQWICKEIVIKRLDMRSKNSIKKRWNWIWDYHASFALGNATLDNREVIFVTDDADLTRILSDYGFANRVMTLGSYKTWLKFDAWYNKF